MAKYCLMQCSSFFRCCCTIEIVYIIGFWATSVHTKMKRNFIISLVLYLVFMLIFFVAMLWIYKLRIE